MAGQMYGSGGSMQFDAPAQFEGDDYSPPGSGMLCADQGPKTSSGFHRVPEDFEDKRVERQKLGLIKYQLEKGVPDVGGLGWRSKQGHVLKNQSFYSAFPNSNVWNNPAHAGPRTWKGYHGPRLRTDAGLMETLDKLDGQQAEWEVNKMYVNTVRVQTLDRFYNQKLNNEQRELHHTWMPHRRAKREYHDVHDRFEVELDSMPMKELKKVLTPAVLHGDRDAIRNITERIQREETWKATWKEMEVQRRKDTLGDMEERMTYNQMLADLAGQPTRRRDPNHRIPNNCSERVEELARPAPERKIEDVTTLTDFKGLIHVDHQVALEARFPGQGHAMSKTFREKATASSAPGWPPPDRPTTPAGRKPQTASSKNRVNLKKASVPASARTLQQALSRTNDEDLSMQAVEAYMPNGAPPPPQQSKTILEQKIVNDAAIMGDTVSQSLHGSVTESQASFGRRPREVQKPPGVRPMVYPVLVKAAANKDSSGSRLGGNLDTDVSPTAPAAGRRAEPAVPRKLPMKDVKIARLGINIISATGIRGADRSGLSDPYCVVRIPGRPKSKFSTKVCKATLNPVWRVSCEVEEFFAGDELEFAVYDKDIYGHECLGKCALPQSMLLPDGVEGELELFDDQRPEGEEGPLVAIKVVVLENFDPDGRLQAKAVRGAEDSDDEPPASHEACRALDDFEAALQPMPRLGNFWMTPRGERLKNSRPTSAQGEGNAQVRPAALDDPQAIHQEQS